MDAAVQGALVALELELLEPAVRASSERVAELLDEAFVEFGASGRCFDKSAVLQALAAEAGDVRYRAFDIEVHSLAPDLAQVRYRSERNGGGEPPRQALRSSLWQYRDGRWRMLFHQGTPIPGGA
ncbi:nuclear transport factor 2 family protein [Xanthomonas sp. A2111]|uniref:Nuclear transport factor 2 family protein n=1 Tax=Xanthomonas hawaiiensis TaxID=3003247 RepID=A0ABU2I8H6_9XANT|nr:nuclear transport factor 2 family protein [Xanthomonas sp. A2111]MBO9826851.1 nuclear transport factor 2 family protein [Xanthomonas sp. A2111]MDS9994062.1 nuclear transport factor 2 family protein [Xanthomonas sp. A2111]